MEVQHMKVWPAALRCLHWALVTAVAVAWWAGESVPRLHEWAGYLALAVVVLRCALGWRHAPRWHYARFGQFVRAPAAVWRYARDVARGREARYVGHNPLGGWMVLALLACVALTALSGWLYTLDAFWGLAWLEVLHKGAAWSLVGLIALHVAGVLFTSWRHRENLVRAMLGGHKAGAGPHDVA